MIKNNVFENVVANEFVTTCDGQKYVRVANTNNGFAIASYVEPVKPCRKVDSTIYSAIAVQKGYGMDNSLSIELDEPVSGFRKGEWDEEKDGFTKSINTITQAMKRHIKDRRVRDILRTPAANGSARFMKAILSQTEISAIGMLLSDAKVSVVFVDVAAGTPSLEDASIKVDVDTTIAVFESIEPALKDTDVIEYLSYKGTRCDVFKAVIADYDEAKKAAAAAEAAARAASMTATPESL